MRYALPEPLEPAWERGLRLGLIVGLHAALIAVLLTVTLKPALLAEAIPLAVRVMEEDTKKPEKIRPPLPLHQMAQPVISMPPLPVLASEAAGDTSFAVAPQPPAPVAVPVAAPPAVAAPAGSAEEPVTPAQFDVDTLHNPPPRYPYSARRSHEEGRVLLKVLVSAEGSPLSVTLLKTSGVPALDDAALEVVKTWRFIAARRGDRAIEQWLNVPIRFHLDK